MSLAWLQRNRSAEGNQTDDIEIKPEQFSAALKPELDTFRSSIGTEMDTKLSPILEFINQQKADREAAAARAAAAQRTQQQSELEIQPEDYITDPEGVMNKRLKPLQDTIAAQSAIIVRDKTLSKMDYYSSDPTFAAKVDALIDSQPLNLRANASVVMNAYKSVFFDMKDEIASGKIKSQASAANFSNGGTGNHSGKDSESNADVLSAEEKHYAAKLGLTEADWIKSKRELEYV
jgi:phage I-like protein